GGDAGDCQQLRPQRPLDVWPEHAVAAAIRPLRPGLAGRHPRHHRRPVGTGDVPEHPVSGGEPGRDRGRNGLELRRQSGLDLERGQRLMPVLTDVFVVGSLLLSILLTIQSAYTLYLMLYTWDQPRAYQKAKAPQTFVEPARSFTVMLPARHEED